MSSTTNIVVIDPVAYRFLANDPGIKRVDTNKQYLEGYECYIVEQWAVSRTHATFAIVAYSADKSHHLKVHVLSVPSEETSWSPRLKMYFDHLRRNKAKATATEFGVLHVTNLTTFQSSLTVILVPSGDILSHREDFYVNENLKRLNCSGRTAINLQKPSPATIAKFYQLYRTSEKILFNVAVVELIKICQNALMLFGHLDREYMDGLFCDKTEHAVKDWWLDYGSDHYSVEPQDGVLGPTTVAALLGSLMGARNRLDAFGSPVGKDAFDIENMKRAIAYFQKLNHIPKTRRLDRQTLTKLHKSTAKAVTGGRWFVPKAVKSTVAELSGKSGEMVMDIVGGRDRSGIADVETVDYDEFYSQISGPKAKWLWQGKRTTTQKPHSNDNENDHSHNNQNGSLTDIPNEWTSDYGDSVEDRRKNTKIVPEERDRERNKLMKRLPERIVSTKPGLGKFKGAVGLKGSKNQQQHQHHHHHQHQQHSHHHHHHQNQYNNNLRDQQIDGADALTSQEELNFSANPPYSENTATFSKAAILSPDTLSNSNLPTLSPRQDNQVYYENIEPPSDSDLEKAPITIQPTSPTGSPDASVAGSYKDDREDTPNKIIAPPSSRRRSFSDYEDIQTNKNFARFPRQLSFSVAEEGLSAWAYMMTKETGDSKSNIEYARKLCNFLHHLERDMASWVKAEVSNAEKLDEDLFQDQTRLSTLFYTQNEYHKELDRRMTEISSEEREELTSIIKNIEVLGAKLEYEINVLRNHVEDIESAMAEFERQVILVEDRVSQMEKSMEPRESWYHWMERIFAFLRVAQPSRDTH